MRKILFILLVSFLGLISCSKPLVLEKYRFIKSGIKMFGDTPERNFYIKENISDSLELLWNSDTHGSYSNTKFITYDSLLYVPDLSGRIYAFYKNSGKEIGVIKNKGEIAIAPVVRNKIMVFVLNELKEQKFSVHFYSLNSGIENKLEFPGSCKNEMLVINEDIYLLNDAGTLYKFNFNGKKIWEVKTEIPVLSSPVGWNGNVVWGNSIGEIISVSINGKLQFRKKINSGFEGGAIIIQNNLIIPDVNRTLISYNVKDKKVNWELKNIGKIKNFPVHNNVSLFAGTLEGKLFSIDYKAGKINWQTDLNGLINATPLLFRNILVQPNLFKKIDLINIENGKVIKSIRLEGRAKSTPHYDSGIIYFGVDYGEIYAYRIIENED